MQPGVGVRCVSMPGPGGRVRVPRRASNLSPVEPRTALHKGTCSHGYLQLFPEKENCPWREASSFCSERTGFENQVGGLGRKDTAALSHQSFLWQGTDRPQAAIMHGQADSPVLRNHTCHDYLLRL